ncbi:ARFGAP2 (predicted) [Pycnogonum litorale]
MRLFFLDRYNDSPFTSKYLDTSSSSSYRKESLKNSSADEVDGRKNKSSSGGNNNNNSSSSATAQKKFGNAKSISSDQFFDGKRDSDFEHRANLAKFEGSSSISSADYFGEPQKKTASSYKNYNFNTPNLSDIKDGVKDGVNIVAGRLSNIATGVMSSFQDKYGY